MYLIAVHKKIEILKYNPYFIKELGHPCSKSFPIRLLYRILKCTATSFGYCLEDDASCTKFVQKNTGLIIWYIREILLSYYSCGSCVFLRRLNPVAQLPTPSQAQ